MKAILFALLFVVGVANSCYVDDYEPNDNCTSASICKSLPTLSKSNHKCKLIE